MTQSRSRLRGLLERLRSAGPAPRTRVQELQRSVDELRTSVEELSRTVAGVGETGAGHAAWLSDLQESVSRTIAGAGEIRAGFSDLQTWMTSCVQTLRALAETPPIASPRVEAAAAPARRIDEVDRIRRHLLVFTVMNWVEHADVPCERLVSVIMPTRNRHEWIGRAIASVQAQTYTRWELVVGDDGSSDGTPALLADVAACDVARHR